MDRANKSHGGEASGDVSEETSATNASLSEARNELESTGSVDAPAVLPLEKEKNASAEDVCADPPEPPTDPHDIELSHRYAKMSFVRKYFLELVFMLYIFPTFAISTPMTDTFMKKACLYNLGFSEELCANLKNHTAEEAQVQIVSNEYATAKSIITTLPGKFVR